MDQKTHETIEKLRRGQRRHRRAWMVAAVAVVLAWAMPAASVTTVPYVFAPGTPARASEINANFAALASAIDALDAANDTRLDALETRDDFVPSGTIAFFAASACPSGWTEYAAANGRYVVAVTSGSTVEGTVGAAMADVANPTHNHTIQHRHVWSRFNAAQQWLSYTSNTPGETYSVIYDHGDGLNTEGSGFYPLASTSTASSGFLYTGDPSAANSGTASTGAIAPYIQLLACQKS